jgi:hypothetical protein
MEITTPCRVCASKAAVAGGSAMWADRGKDWPVTEVAGATVHRSCASDAEYIAGAAAEVAVSAGGVATWTTNGRPLPDDAAALLVDLGLAEGVDLAATKAASDQAAREAIAAYAAAQPAQPSEEERAEMRAAFGPGATVVDVLTGREVQL